MAPLGHRSTECTCEVAAAYVWPIRYRLGRALGHRRPMAGGQRSRQPNAGRGQVIGSEAAQFTCRVRVI